MVGEMLPPKLKDSVERNMSLDGLLLQATEATGSEILQPHIYTKQGLLVSILENGQIVKVDLMSDPRSLKLVQLGSSYTLQLSVKFAKMDSVNDPYGNRFDRYIDHDFFSSIVRRDSNINSLIAAVVMIGFACNAIRRIWKQNNDPTGLNAADEEEALLPLGNRTADDNGTWKKLEARDVFSPPNHTILLAALLGNGWQLVALAFGVVMWLSGQNPLDFGPGGRLGSVLYGYAATSIVAGYVSGYYFRQQSHCSVDTEDTERKEPWVLAMAITALILPSIAAAIELAICLAAIQAGTIDVISPQGIQRLLLLWICVAVPLGTLLGRWHHETSSSGMHPIDSFSALSMPPPKIAQAKWMTRHLQIIRIMSPLGGLLPWGVICIETCYFVTSLWKYKLYIVHASAICELVLLVVVTSASSTLATSALLNNPLVFKSWQWGAFQTFASTGGYCFLYSIHYLFSKTQMTGAFQAIYYFGYMLLLSIAVALACGAIAHFAAYRSVRLLYSNIKSA